MNQPWHRSLATPAWLVMGVWLVLNVAGLAYALKLTGFAALGVLVYVGPITFGQIGWMLVWGMLGEGPIAVRGAVSAVTAITLSGIFVFALESVELSIAMLGTLVTIFAPLYFVWWRGARISRGLPLQTPSAAPNWRLSIADLLIVTTLVAVWLGLASVISEYSGGGMLEYVLFTSAFGVPVILTALFAFTGRWLFICYGAFAGFMTLYGILGHWNLGGQPFNFYVMLSSFETMALAVMALTLRGFGYRLRCWAT